MKLQKREKMLLGAVGGLIAAAGLVLFVVTGDSTSDETLLKDKETKTAELVKKQKEKKQADDDRRRLVDWQKRSLPPDPSIARSLYQSWLRELCGSSGLREPHVLSEQSEPHRIGGEDIYTRIPFSVHASANLDQIVTFLHGFYSAGHLHQIRRLHIAPLPGRTQDFDLNVAIEALSLPKAVNNDHLATEPSQALKLPQLAAYRDVIEKRNFFAVYVPESPQRVGNVDPSGGRGNTLPPRGSPPDDAQFAVVTGFTKDEEDGLMRVWLRDRMKNKTWHLKEGEQFKVGGGTGQVRTIMAPEGEVIIRFDGKLRELHLEESLRGGKELKE
jgi:hypothetical protein